MPIRNPHFYRDRMAKLPWDEWPREDHHPKVKWRRAKEARVSRPSAMIKQNAPSPIFLISC